MSFNNETNAFNSSLEETQKNISELMSNCKEKIYFKDWFILFSTNESVPKEGETSVPTNSPLFERKQKQGWILFPTFPAA